jgi:hypothetical protein
MKNIRTWLTWIFWIFALIAGLIVLAGYFIPAMEPWQDLLLQVAIPLAAFTMLAGVFNLLSVHWQKIEEGQKGSGYSIVLVLSFFLPLIAAGLDLWFSGKPVAYWQIWVFRYLQVPVESTLFALLAIVLVYAIIRMMRRRLTPFALIFFATVSVVLLLSSPYITSFMPELEMLRDGITDVLAMGGARGILLGVALGTIATGIRVLMGVERPYG